MQLTHVGGPTTLVELGGWRILTDPTFDAPGRRYGFGLGTSSVKTAGPAVRAEDVGDVDVVLVSHDHHADNLDDAGRALLPRATAVLTTVPGRARLGAANVRGMRAGDVVTLTAEGRPALRVTATPCRHGPPLSRRVVGEVVGFALSLGDDVGRTALWMTGDTVLHRPLLRAAAALDVDVLLMHLGRVRFGLTGPLRYSMDADDAARLVRAVAPRVAVPVHYEGWSHFSQPASEMRAVLDDDPRLARTVRVLEPGVAATV